MWLLGAFFYLVHTLFAVWLLRDRHVAMEEKRCAFVVTKRQRRCRMVACKGSVYCGEHLVYDKQASGLQRKRVPCPLDPSHTVYEDTLKKHLKKCNVAKRVHPLCHFPGINEGIVQDSPPEPHPPLTLANCPPERLEELIKRIEAAYEDHMPSLKEEILTHPCMASDIRDPANGASALKHLFQQSSILAHLEGCGFLDVSKVSCFVEFGAGRGKLTHCIHRAIQHVTRLASEGACEVPVLDYVLVDRASCRRKVDGAHRASAALAGANCHRLLLDIKDLDLSRVEVVRGRGYVGVAKHLCGAATDMALRCMLNHKHSEVSACDLMGVAIALCCHHRCTWGQLVGSEFMLRLGFTPEDFVLMCHMTSWGVCGCRPPASGKEGEAQANGKEDKTSHLTASVKDGCPPAGMDEGEGGSMKEGCLPAGEGEEEDGSMKEGFPPAGEGEGEDGSMKEGCLPAGEGEGEHGPLPAGVKNGEEVKERGNGHQGGGEKKRWGYVPHPKEEIGLKCKRLLDLARVRYLEQHGLKARLVFYVDKKTSLENVLLLATVD